MRIKQRLLKISIASLVILFWLWVGLQNLVPSGRFETSTDFTGVNPWLPGLRPIERVVNRNTIIGDPIYIDIRLPAHFDELRLKVNYENKSQGDVRVGIFTDKDKWQILFGELKNGEATFDLRGLSLKKNIVPVVFGTPAATSLEPVIVHQIDVTATKPPLSQNDFKELSAKPKYASLFVGLLILMLGFLLLVFLPIGASTFAVMVSAGSFLVAGALEWWRPGLVANFVDSRLFILVIVLFVAWYWMERRKSAS